MRIVSMKSYCTRIQQVPAPFIPCNVCETDWAFGDKDPPDTHILHVPDGVGQYKQVDYTRENAILQ